MTARSNEYLDDQSRDFHDTDGRRWRVRVEQGGGSPGAHDAAPVAVLIFRALDGSHVLELRIAGEWDLGSYPETRLRALLREAQTHATEPAAE